MANLQTPFILTLSLTVLAPILVAAGNYLLISRLIRAVLPASHHRVLGIPGGWLTPIFVTCDGISLLVQGNGSGVASSGNWTGHSGEVGRYILIGGLIFQLVSFGLFLGVFGRFHFLANRLAKPDAPVGWRKVVTAVYISCSLIMVSKTPQWSRTVPTFLPRSVVSIARASFPRAWTATRSSPSGCSGCLRLFP